MYDYLQDVEDVEEYGYEIPTVIFSKKKKKREMSVLTELNCQFLRHQSTDAPPSQIFLFFWFPHSATTRAEGAENWFTFHQNNFQHFVHKLSSSSPGRIHGGLRCDKRDGGSKEQSL